MTTEQTYEKDYSLLRPVDKATLKPGDTVCYWGDGSLGEYLGPYIGSEEGSDVCLRLIEESHEEGIRVGDCIINALKYYRQAPLCWLEGKPVYQGDVLYYKNLATRGNYDKVKAGKELSLTPGWIICEDGCTRDTKRMIWNLPKVKKQYFVNLYSSLSHLDDEIWGYKYETRDIADENAAPNRLVCVMIEVEE